MDHLDSMLQGNLDDLVPSQVSTNWGVLSALSDHIGFIGFCKNNSVSN